MADNQPSTPSAAEGFQLLNSQNYPANYGYREANRLNLQHFLWRESFQFNIHPSILPRIISSPPSEAPLNIADIVCGTGLWLMDVARELPKAQLDGLDINLALAPRELPSNIAFREWDLFQNPVPPDLVGKYDLIHVRSLAMRLAGKDLKSVIGRLYQLLKPGGYLQWDESDYKNMGVAKTEPAVTAPSLTELAKLWHSDGRHDWTIALPQLLGEEGFQTLVNEHFDDKPELVTAFHSLHLLTLDEFALAIIRMGKHEAAAQIFKMVSDGIEEHRQGATLSIPRLVVVATK
ncbi:hypothetical protein MGYG_00655 [Nannizzia gypsea CBS 118893]|uniref:Methyltransferase type 12 domain-containing protein n=1 Tax=Arthroderma gypseum (strain ATCC MYA-4604 / CBS 118893) TaxID=535722 RepID=E5R112_ARTGP|nr:hypothetical protein MGYG_00655 [Nannizzia gypsea CBS 118893]EFQ97616.1 hypothetical protein MGYG_00655 [Nannizzia gypsea CBS 118893]